MRCYTKYGFIEFGTDKTNKIIPLYIRHDLMIMRKNLTTSTRDTITRKNGYFGIRFVDRPLYPAIGIEAHSFADELIIKPGSAFL